MISNAKIELSPESNYRKISENIIRYTLCLDYKNIDIVPGENIHMKTILDNVENCCIPLITSDGGINSKFFGTQDSHVISRVELNDMILQNSVMECYHAILSEYLSSCNNITSYQIISSNGHGANAAYKSNALSLNKKQQVIYHVKKTKNLKKNPDTKCGKSSDFNKNLTIRRKRFEPFVNFLTSYHNKKKHYPLQYASICYAIKNAKVSHLNTLLSSGPKNLSTESFLEALKALTSTLTPTIAPFKETNQKNFPSFGGNIVDGVYHYYIAEKAFGFNLFYSLLRNIEQTRKPFFYVLNEPALLILLSKCAKLPNAFSRTYFLRFAFNHISNETDSYNDYWSFHKIDERYKLGSLINKREQNFHFEKWLLQYELFIDYMSDLVIPVYDWCVLLMLLNGVEKAHPESSHMEHLEEALKILSEYIRDNYRSIMQPEDPYKKNKVIISSSIVSEKNIPPDNIDIVSKKNTAPDGIDIVSEKNFYTLIDAFSLSELEIIRQEFYSNRDTELNLQPLTLDKFTQNSSENTKNIQDLYIDMLFINPRNTKEI